MKSARQLTPIPRVNPKAGFGKPYKGFLVCVAFILVQVCTSFVRVLPVRRNQYLALKAHDQLGILSFDLDDTLFSTTDVVRAANDKMIQEMIDRGCSDASLPKFLDTTRSIRSKLDGPVTYQSLRKKAIRETFLASSGINSKELYVDMLVDKCYDAWEQERHAAAERFLFPDAIETMKELRCLYPDSCFVAITNGAGDPLKMPNTLAPFFNFRVSGEEGEVFPYRKPHSFIYEYALNKYKDSTAFAAGAWCHVGDCLANDVGASASCGAEAIWMCLEDDKESAASRLVSSTNHPEWSTATTHELEKRKAQVDEGKKSVAATIYKLSQLPTAISTILEKVQ